MSQRPIAAGDGVVSRIWSRPVAPMIVLDERDRQVGKLSYDLRYEVEFADRALQHLQIVITTKFRRGESFNFSWVKDTETGSGRTTLWMHPAIPLLYEFSGNRVPAINPAWLEALMNLANSAGGLHLIPETDATENITG
jgi:hypothetical protein